VKDEDLLGFSSQSITTFDFNLWKLKKFGCSDYILWLNDDYFIGKPLDKSDFFYEDGDKVKPYVFYNEPILLSSENKIESTLKRFEGRFSKSGVDEGVAQNFLSYEIQTCRGYAFLFKTLGCKQLNIPKNVWSTLHNAKSYTLPELKEIYDVIDKGYPDAEICLTSKMRNNAQITHQPFYDFYYLNKDNRKINHDMTYKYIDLARAPKAKFDTSLFCINTSGDREYSLAEKQAAHAKMEELFPNKTPYEK
jgi:hypothetical protein